MSARGGKSVRHASPLMQAGFTMVPNVVLLREDLTVHAKLFYALLWHYARADEAAYPGQRLLHTKMPCSPRGLRNAKDQLEAAGLLATVQRGRGRTNQYILLDPAGAETPQEAKERIKRADQERHEVPIKNGTRCRSRTAPGADPCVTKTQKKKTHSEEPPKTPLPAQRAPGGEVVQLDLLQSSGRTPAARARAQRTARRLQGPDPTNGATT